MKVFSRFLNIVMESALWIFRGSSFHNLAAEVPKRRFPNRMDIFLYGTSDVNAVDMYTYVSLNINKTYYILFHRARIKLPDVSLNTYINNCKLTGTECYKYLGVILDSKMSWVQHITYVKSKVSKGIGIMYQARKYLDKNSLVNLYNTYIYPYLIYCV